MERIGLIIALAATVISCEKQAQETTSRQEFELPTHPLVKGESARYIYFNESGAIATTDPGRIHAVTAYGVMVYDPEKTAVIPDALEWGLNLYVDEIARIEPRDAVVIRAYAGATGEWAANLVTSRARLNAEANPQSEASLDEAAQVAALAERLKGIPGAEKLSTSELNRRRIARWAISTRPNLEDFGLSENPGLTVVFVTANCTGCDAWRKLAEETPHVHIVEVAPDDPKFRNLMSLVGQPPLVPAAVTSGKVSVGPP